MTELVIAALVDTIFQSTLLLELLAMTCISQNYRKLNPMCIIIFLHRRVLIHDAIILAQEKVFFARVKSFER